MRKYLIILAVFAAALTVRGVNKTLNDLPYYDADFPRRGDAAYIAERCKLDLYYPEHRKGFSTVVVFHGGGLIRGGKNLYPALLERGFAVAAVNYRLSGPQAKCPDYIYDAAAAVAWVMKHIAEYGGDPKMVFVAGHSAGGYLTAMVALDPRYLGEFGFKPSQLAGAFASSGQMTTHDQILREYRRQGKKVPQVVIDEYAPLSYIDKDAPPLIFSVGDDATEVPGRVGENKMLHSLLVAKGHPNCQFFQYPGFPHGQAWHPAMQKLWMWIQAAERSARRKAEHRAQKAEKQKVEKPQPQESAR